MSPARAVGVVSGGLDSLLAVEVVRRMGLRVTSLHFAIGFEPRHLRGWIERPGDPPRASDALMASGAEVEVHDVRAEYMPLLADPPHGFGSRCNPCIDCHAMMLSKARTRMEELGAAFAFSGEVLGQRPMSQNRQALGLVARLSGLNDRLVRPLSGALLPPTAPEREGVLRRSDLLDIQGRSRRRQTELAARFGLTDYPTPAGGCLLTDPQFCSRLTDLFDRREGRVLRVDDPILLFVGRHVALPAGSKAVIGRDQHENDVVERFAHTGRLLVAVDIPGPSTLVEGQPAEQDIQAAARLTARYGKGKDRQSVPVRVTAPDGSERTLEVKPKKPDGCLIL